MDRPELAFGEVCHSPVGGDIFEIGEEGWIG
jgi:hypothetical protein